MAEPVCAIKCVHCNALIPSPIKFATKDVFLSSTLVGNQLQCKKCGELTRCNKENMYFNPKDGTIHTGEETIPDAE